VTGRSTDFDESFPVVAGDDGTSYAIVPAECLVPWTASSARSAVAEALADPTQRADLVALARQLGAKSTEDDAVVAAIADALQHGDLLAFEAPAPPPRGRPITRRDPVVDPPVRPTPTVSAWVSFQLLDHDGTPIGDRSFTFEHADGRIDSVELDADGRSSRIVTTAGGGIHLEWPSDVTPAPHTPRASGFVARPDDLRVPRPLFGTTRLGLNRHWRVVIAARRVVYSHSA
jgi:hypothetical protein